MRPGDVEYYLEATASERFSGAGGGAVYEAALAPVARSWWQRFGPAEIARRAITTRPVRICTASSTTKLSPGIHTVEEAGVFELQKWNRALGLIQIGGSENLMNIAGYISPEKQSTKI